jgi:LPS O-antigen subunit length determinant protein (WzzB/FepE family)
VAARDVLQALLVIFIQTATGSSRQNEELLGRLPKAPLEPIPNAVVEEVRTQIVDPPEVPRVPITPNRALMIACVFIIGLATGFGISGLPGFRSGHA